jgi:hypothetical protein
MSLKAGVGVEVVKVESLGGYRLALTFSDGHVSRADFGPFLRASLNPETRQFLKSNRFSNHTLRDRNLVWGDYAMCFPIEDIYEGIIGPCKPVSPIWLCPHLRAGRVGRCC